MNIENFETDLGNNLAIVDFFADWCSPCRTLGPIIERVSEESGIKLLKINVDEAKDLSSSLNVRGIPTVIFFKGGKEVERVVGLKQASAYNEIIERHSV
jgi:thioredoxin 1